jgi:hypothetical protein
MIGFTARDDSGKIQIDGEEIAGEGRDKADSLAQWPGKLSIARHLIGGFVAKRS